MELSCRPTPLLLLTLASVACVVAKYGNETCTNVKCITFLHFNDVHDRTDPDDISYGACNMVRGDPCYGGYARFATVVRNATEEAKAMGCTPFLVHAGDELRGTLWDDHWFGMDAVRFYNYLGVDAQTVGNHEFNLGLDGLLNYSKALQFPILSANGNYANNSALAAVIKPYTILDAGDGVKVGLVGITPAGSSSRVQWMSELEASNKYIKELQSQGIKINVLLSHAGYPMDLLNAPKLQGTQLVIGAHSHTFLANPPYPVLRVDAQGDPLYDVVDGPYPTIRKGADGQDVHIVQAGWGTRYLGVFNTEWCVDTGELLSYDGEPVLVNSTTPVHQDVYDLIESVAEPIRRANADPVGETLVPMTHIRLAVNESNLGNNIADAQIWGLRNRSPEVLAMYPTLPYIALYGSGIMRVDIPKGNITWGQIVLVLTGETLCGVHLGTGAMLRSWLTRANRLDLHANGMQIANFRYGRDLTLVPEDRVLNIEVTDPVTNTTRLLRDDEQLIMLARPGSFPDAKIIAEDSYNWVTHGRVIWKDFLNATSPVSPRIEGRIVNCDEPGRSNDAVCAARPTSTAG